MYDLYVDGKYNATYLALEVVLAKAKNYLKRGQNIEIQARSGGIMNYNFMEHAEYALPN